jgi:hypothetical protein
MAHVRRLLLLFGLALVTRVAIFGADQFSDEPTYSALAVKIDADAALPYAGAVDHKPPGIELVYAGVFAVTGRYNLLAVRLLLVAVVAATALALGKVARRFGGGELAAAILYVLASTWGLSGDMQSANTELFLNLPLVIAAWLVMTGGVARCAAAGALTAVAALFKYQAALAGMGWIVIVGLDIAQLAALALGFAAVAVAYVGTFWLAGVWTDFVFWGWGYNFRYVAALSPGDVISNGLFYTGVMALFWTPLLVAFLRPSRQLARAALPWLGAMTLATSVGGRFFPHYYLMMLPPVVLLAVRGFDATRRGRLARSLAGVFTGVAVALSIVRPEVTEYGHHYIEAQRHVGAWIRDHSRPDDRVFVWGNSSLIYFVADRVMATRFAFCNYHTGKMWGTPYFERESPGAPELVVHEAWPELLADLAASRPRYIVDGGAGHIGNFDLDPITDFPDLAAVVSRDYQLAATIDGVPIYSRTR